MKSHLKKRAGRWLVPVALVGALGAVACGTDSGDGAEALVTERSGSASFPSVGAIERAASPRAGNRVALENQADQYVEWLESQADEAELAKSAVFPSVAAIERAGSTGRTQTSAVFPSVAAIERAGSTGRTQTSAVFPSVAAIERAGSTGRTQTSAVFPSVAAIEHAGRP
jgi:hypothetical protein